MLSANHPVWAIIRTVVILTALAVVLWINATNFDATEVTTIVSMFLAAIGAETATKLMANKASH